MEIMLDFYVGKLGMRIVDDNIITGDLVRFVSDNRYDTYRVVLLKPSVIGTMLELIEYIGDRKLVKTENGATITLLVSSLENEIKRLRKEGVQQLSDVFSVSFPVVGDSYLVFYEDPEKNKVELLQMKDI